MNSNLFIATVVVGVVFSTFSPVEAATTYNSGYTLPETNSSIDPRIVITQNKKNVGWLDFSVDPAGDVTSMTGSVKGDDVTGASGSYLGSTASFEFYTKAGTYDVEGTNGVWYVKFPNGTDGSVAAPEPMTWAIMLVGFGLAGASLRRRRAPAIW